MDRCLVYSLVFLSVDLYKYIPGYKPSFDKKKMHIVALAYSKLLFGFSK